MPDEPHPQWLRTGSDFVTIEVIVRPGSQHRGLLRVEPHGLVIGVGSLAEKGKANDQLIATIADMVEVPRREVSILRGTAARDKVIRITTIQPARIVKRLSGLSEGEAKVKHRRLR